VVETAPAQWHREARLRDGSAALIRPITPSDGVAWRAFYARLSDRTVYRRFFGHHPVPSDTEVEYFVTVDEKDRMAFVAEQDGAILGVGRYDLIGTQGAEVAFAVADENQRNGIGTALLDALIEHAASKGIHKFLAATLSDNTTMLNIFRRAGFNVQSTSNAGTTRVDLDLPAKDPAAALSAD
jgi:GNAT superfamily N-acetyltransferase